MGDNSIISEVFRNMLESYGYSVVITETGEEALDFVKGEIESKRTLSGLIFDLTIPGAMGGKDAIGKIREITTDIPAFVTSGYSDDPVMVHPEKYGFNGSIHKPFMEDELAKLMEKHMSIQEKT